MTDETMSSYDQIPYPNLSYAQSHPDRLATLAMLRGMSPVPIGRCRVLELGCAGGGNLIPMAYGLPQTEFVGIDNSARQIAQGQAMITALGLENIALRCLDILDVNADLGQFDYIIAHGVFSWVPRPVQDKVLEICKQNLAPNGVAYVSYNTYPGWRMLGIIRDMMLYRTRKLSDPQMRATQARALLDFLAESVPAENGAYGSFLNMYSRLLQGEQKGPSHRGDAFLLHDELEEVNEPFYFYQFAERAERHGLQYLGEAEFRTMVDSNFPPEVSARLRQMSESVIELEQYMDFLRNRMFRKTLLCHQGITLSRRLRPEQIRAFYMASRTKPVASEPDIHSVAVERFRGPDGAMLSIDHPISKAAMLCLAGVWPQAIPFDALPSLARARLGLDPAGESADGSLDADALVLAANLLKAFTYSDSLVELHVYAPHIVVEVSERPMASPVARFLAQSGDKVTNLRHERVDLDGLDRYLLPYLDGNHNQAALVDLLKAGPIAEGILTLQHDGEPIEDPQEAAAALVESVDRRLRWFAHAALLVG